jgi:hypothetical protein
MQRFINGDNTQFDWLRSQIQEALMTFQDVTLPDSCTPNRCRLGFEHTQANGFKLYIDTNIAFSGNNPGFRVLLANGEASFRTYDEMVAFVRGLGCLFVSQQQPHNPPLSLSCSVTSPHGNHMTFSFQYEKCWSFWRGSFWRAFIVNSPSYRSRSSSGYVTHRISTIGGRYYICWDPPPKELDQMIEISKLWAEATAKYIDTGERF